MKFLLSQVTMNLFQIQKFLTHAVIRVKKHPKSFEVETIITENVFIFNLNCFSKENAKNITLKPVTLKENDYKLA